MNEATNQDHACLTFGAVGRSHRPTAAVGSTATRQPVSFQSFIRLRSLPGMFPVMSMTGPAIPFYYQPSPWQQPPNLGAPSSHCTRYLMYFPHQQANGWWPAEQATYIKLSSLHRSSIFPVIASNQRRVCLPFNP